MEVLIYTRAGCHLCEEAVTAAEALRERFGFTLEMIDIEGDDELHGRYLEAIPVVLIDGVERLREDDHRHGGLEEALRAASGA
ncbi:MAG: glutaredoxin family protein [Actinobacteria bacterium]|nr:glutaredoxin family protein [Actinomycetota bacterium]